MLSVLWSWEHHNQLVKLVKGSGAIYNMYIRYTYTIYVNLPKAFNNFVVSCFRLSDRVLLLIIRVSIMYISWTRSKDRWMYICACACDYSLQYILSVKDYCFAMSRRGQVTVRRDDKDSRFVSIPHVEKDCIVVADRNSTPQIDMLTHLGTSPWRRTNQILQIMVHIERKISRR